MLPYFIFNNILSTDFLIVDNLPPIVRASKNINKIEIDGRDGFLTNDLGSYKSTIKTCECWIKNLNDIDFICSWLVGVGEVIFSNETNKKYRATIINQIEFSKVIREFHKFIIQFECQPHKYSIDNNLITITKAQTIFNYGTTNSKPIIKIYGNGNINLTINSNIINLTNVVDYVTIDSEMMDCFKDTMPKNNFMNGEFPELVTGNNSFSWTGTVNSIQIIPNWRYL